MADALGILEVSGFTPAIVAIDTMDKAADVRLFQTELNDGGGVVVKITGDVSAVTAAIEAGREAATRMNGKPVSHRARLVPTTAPGKPSKARSR